MVPGTAARGCYFEGHSKSDAAFLQDTIYTGVPKDGLIHRAIRQVPKLESITNKLKETFAEATTLDELAGAICKAKMNSSAGINGVSYNMLNCKHPLLSHKGMG